MATILGIIDFVVVLLVVVNVILAVKKGVSADTTSPTLTVCMVVALVLFGLISFMGAYGLTEGSAFSQGALLIFLVATAIATSMWRTKNATE
jgi:hypothetical protein